MFYRGVYHAVSSLRATSDHEIDNSRRYFLSSISRRMRMSLFLQADGQSLQDHIYWRETSFEKFRQPAWYLVHLYRNEFIIIHFLPTANQFLNHSSN